jgi:hypothetical protein
VHEVPVDIAASRPRSDFQDAITRLGCGEQLCSQRVELLVLRRLELGAGRDDHVSAGKTQRDVGVRQHGMRRDG